MDNISKLLEVIRGLRDKDTGCPWDIKQTFASIAPYTIEEAYEVAEAIADQDMPALKDELGDLLFQVVFHAQMAEEGGHFNFDEVRESITWNGQHPVQGNFCWDSDLFRDRYPGAHGL